MRFSGIEICICLLIIFLLVCAVFADIAQDKASKEFLAQCTQSEPAFKCRSDSGIRPA
jgi:hypothetical protein